MSAFITASRSGDLDTLTSLLASDARTVRFDTINGLPALLVSGPKGLVQTNAFEIENDAVKAIYVVRNPDKLRHLTSS